MNARKMHLSLVVVALLCAAPAARADRIVTVDGRILTPKKAREVDGGYKLVFENGEVVLKDKSLVKSVEIEGDMSDYVPANDDEKAKLAQGYVRYKGLWMSAPAYQAEMHKIFEAGKKRTEEIAKHADWANAWEKESAHFKVRTNTSPELLTYYCDLLDAYYNLMDERIGIRPSPSLKREKMQVNVYKSYEDFQKLAEPGNPAVLGFFRPWTQDLNFYHDYAEPSRSTWVALHECTHLLTFLIDPQYIPQIWLNEGVADYFGSSKVTRDARGKIKIEPGELQADRVLTVQQALKNESGTTGKDEASPPKSNGPTIKIKMDQRPFTKLEDLFMLTHEQFDGFQYAHAWSFVYFLNNFDNGKYKKSFDKFFKGLYTLEKGIPYKVEAVGSGGDKDKMGGRGEIVAPKDIRDYLLKRLGVKDVPQLEHDWRTFVAGIPIEGPAALLKRGLYSVRMMEFSDAIPDLNAAIEAGVTDARAYAARGRALAFTGKKNDAIKDLRKAVEINPLDSAFQFELSNLLTGRLSMTTHGMPGMDLQVEEGDATKKIKNDEAKSHAGLALELDPENARFYEWFQRFE